MKKMIVISLCLVLAVIPLWGSAVERTDPMTKGYKGDVNMDGEIDAKDALFALRISVTKREFPKNEQDAADVDNSTIVDAKDALEILKYAVEKESVLHKNKVLTSVNDPNNYFYWDVLQDNVCTTEQAWLCETYEDYQTFLDLGYLDDAEKLTDQRFFETYGLVLWYRCKGWSDGSLHYLGAFVQGDRVYLDIVPYGTDALSPNNAIDTVYGFAYKKSEGSINTVLIRENFVTDMYHRYSLSQYEF